MKTILTSILLLFACSYIGAQILLSTDINNPTEIAFSSDATENVYNYVLVEDLDSETPLCGRNFMHQNLYFQIEAQDFNAFKLTLSFEDIYDHGFELFTKSGNDLSHIYCTQVIDSTSSIEFSETDISSGTIFGRIWINEEHISGRLKIGIAPITKSFNRAPVVSVLSMSPEEMVQNVLISGCIQASNIQFTGHPESIGYFTNGSPGLDFSSGIVLSSGAVSKVPGPNNSPATCTNMQMPGDSLLTAIINRATFDAAILEFDFIPSDSIISFQYAFGSEEYEEYVGGVFNDIFTFHISGGPENYQNKNIALISGTNTPVSINNVNQNTNTQYYYNNDNGEHLQFDGMTNTLIAKENVTPCETYHIRLAIADAADPIFDSGVFLKAGSFSSGTIPLVKNYTEDWVLVNTTYEDCSNDLVFARSDNNNMSEPLSFEIEISGTANENIDYTSIPLSLVIPAGQEQLVVPYDVFSDDISEGIESIQIKIFTGCLCGAEYTEEIITVHDPIEITGNISTHDPVCENDTVQISLDLDYLPENYRIEWSTGHTDTTIIDAIITESGFVEAHVYYPCGVKTFSTYIEALPLPQANAFNTSPVCDGDDITFFAENGISYLWKGPNGFFTDENSFEIINASLEQSGIYGVTVTGSNGCVYHESFDVQINEYPQPLLPDSITACERDILLLNPGNFYSYFWQGPANWTSHLNTLNISELSTSHSGTFYLTVADEIGCSTQVETHITVNPSPVAEVFYNPLICTGDNFLIEGSHSGNPTWVTPNQNLIQDYNFFVSNINSEDDGIYGYYLENNFGCKDSTFVDIDVIVPDAQILTNGAFCNNMGLLNLESENPYGTWQAEALVDSVVGIIDLGMLGSGLYDVTYNVGFEGCSDSQTIQIEIQEANQIIITAPESLCSNSGDQILSVEPQGGIWYGDIIIDSISGGINPEYALGNSTTVTYEYSQGVCTSISQVSIEINQAPSAVIVSVGDMCIEDSPIYLQALNPGGYWSGSGMINYYTGKFSPNAAGVGTHTIYYQLSNSECQSIDSIQISVFDNITAEIIGQTSFCNDIADQPVFAQNQGGVWSGFGIVDSLGVFSPSFAGIGEGEVYYEISNGGCYSRDTAVFSVNQAINAEFSLPEQFCLYENLHEIISVNDGGIWSGSGITDSLSSVFNPLTAGIGVHSITHVTNNNGCQNSYSAQVEVLDAPNPDFVAENVYCSENINYQLSAMVPGGIWSGDGIIDNNNGFFNPQIAGLGYHEITYTVSNTDCTSIGLDTILVIDGSESIFFNVPDTVCINSNIITLNAEPIFGYWTGVGVVDGSYFDPSIAGFGSHQLTYNLGTGACTISDEVSIFVQNILPASLMSETEYCKNSQPIALLCDIDGGQWSGSSVVDGLFNPQMADTGVNIVYYEYISGNCINEVSFELFVFDVQPVFISGVEDEYCQNDNLITPVFSPQGGTISGISFSENAFNPQNLPIGQNHITYSIEDNHGCISSTTKNFEILEVPEIVISGIQSEYCLNSPDVSFHVSPHGGTFTGVEISDHWFSPSSTGVGEHTLSYFYTTPHGCSTLHSQIVTIASDPEIFFEINQLPTCNGDANASVSVFCENQEIEALVWNDVNHSTLSTLENINSGWYSVTVSTIEGCQKTDSVYIPQQDAIQADISGTQILDCTDTDNGIIDVSVSGGVPPYNFSWSDNQTLNSQHRSGLSSGDYIVSITDSNNCLLVMEYFIGSSQSTDYEILIDNNIICHGDNSASVEISNYNLETILWNDGSESFLRTNLSAGVYYISLTDSFGCQIQDSIFIEEPDPIQITTFTDSVICGEHLGGIIAGANGGVEPYNYIWSNDEETSSIFNLPVGVYTLTVTDYNNCQTIENIEIFATNSIDAEIIIVDELMCYGEFTGVLKAITNDGISPVTYSWSNNSHAEVITGLSAGDYMVTLTDSWGCLGIAREVLESPRQIVYESNVTNVNCKGEDSGSISILAHGGTGELNCQWNNNTLGFLNDNLTSGLYSFTIRDQNNCRIDEEIFVSEPDQSLSYNVSFKEPDCFGEDNGILTAHGVGGVEPYTYSWEYGNYATDATTIANLQAGKYLLKITDANNCYIQSEIELSQPDKIDALYKSIQPTCNGKQDGEVNLYPIGGVEPYSVMYRNMVYNNVDFSDLFPGEYSFVIIDANECQSEEIIVFVPESNQECISIPNAFSPNNDGINDVWEIENIEMFPTSRIQVFNRWGQLVFETRSNEELWDGKSTWDDCPTGTYVYIIDLFSGAESYTGTVSLVR